jgi:glutathione S-transferase
VSPNETHWRKTAGEEADESSHYNPTKNEDALNRYVEQTDRCYSVLEGQLKKTNGESILPGGVTAVDAHYEPWVRQHAFAQVPVDKYPNLKKWLEKIGGLEEVKKAYEKIQKAPKPGES